MHFHPTRRQALLASGASLAALCGAPLRAQGWPDKTIRIVVPFAPGAGTDAVGRLMAQKLAELLDSPVVVDNRAGASGAIGTQFVAQSPADGHTLLLVAAPFTTVPAALPGAGYDPVRHFAPVGMIASGPLVWAVNKDLPVRSLRELVTLARQKPGYLNYGSAGAGGINHLVPGAATNYSGPALGRNRDELTANMAPHGLAAHASHLVGKSPDFAPTRRARGFSGGLPRCKTRQGVQPCLGFCALHPIPKNRERGSRNN